MTIILDFFPDDCEWSDVCRGQHGYHFQRQLVSHSLVLGWLSFGSKHGRHWLYFTGAGLRHRRDNDRSDCDLASLCDLNGSRLGRIDIALDLYDHSVFSVHQSISAHAAGQYKLTRAPANPHSEIFQSDTKCDGYEVARTHYLGKRNASKRLRVYDKGLQVLGRLSSDELEEYKQRGIVRGEFTPEGAHIEEWTRVELIYKHDKRRPLSKDMITARDEFFAGAYPLLADLLSSAGDVRPSYIPRDEDCEFARLAKACHDSYGGLLFHMKHDRGMSDAEIIAELIGSKSAARLMVDKERPQ